MVVLPQATRSTVRIGWMDAMRGLAITLVVFDHSLAHTAQYSGAAPHWLELLSKSLNPLRMPLMAFLSGTLLAQSLAKGPREYVAGKIRNILFPYVLWSVIFVTLWILVTPITGTPHSWYEYVQILYHPQGHMWFLYYIFTYYIMMLFVKDVPTPVVVLGAWAVAAVCTLTGHDIWERFFFLFGFFVLGHYVILNPGPVQRLLANPYAVGVMIVLALGMPVTELLMTGTIRYEPISVPMTLGAVGLMLIGMSAIGEHRYLALFRYIGRNSLQVYVLHFTIIAIAVIVATRILGIGDPRVVFVIGLSGGMLGSLLAVWLIKVLNLGMLFSWPRPNRRPPGDKASEGTGARVARRLATEPRLK